MTKNTLIIHPEDRTTDFLIRIYQNIKAKVIRKTQIVDVFSEAKKANRVICLSHGVAAGSLDTNMRIVVDDSFAELFRQQPDNIYIWCRADAFVARNRLSAFCTGMFVSEEKEAWIFDLKATPEQIAYSNELFCKLVNYGVRNKFTHEQMVDYVLPRYYDQTNEVMEYNRQRIYAFRDGVVTRSLETVRPFAVDGSDEETTEQYAFVGSNQIGEGVETRPA